MAGEDWPQDWYRPFLGGWPLPVLAVLLGVTILAAAVAGPARADGLGVLGLVAAAGLPLSFAVICWPRFHGRPVPLGDAVALPFSRPRMAARIAAPACGGTVAVVASADRPWLAAVGALIALVGVPVAVWQNPWDAAVVLSPEGVELVHGDRTRRAAWDAGLDVVAFDDVVRTGGIAVHRPFVRVYRWERGTRRRRLMFTFPGHHLTVGPLTAYALLKRYADDPAAPAELAANS